MVKIKRDVLVGKGAVKATMLHAHLAWARQQLGDLSRLLPRLEKDCGDLLTRQTLSTAWVPFRCLVLIDRAIAAEIGGDAEKVFRSLGRHSAAVNLGGVYKRFVTEEPHRVFAQMGVLHSQFQNFGRWDYEQKGDRAGLIILDGYSEYSPAYCISAAGYFEQALKMMHAPGPIVVRETSCQCAGDPRCAFDMSW